MKITYCGLNQICLNMKCLLLWLLLLLFGARKPRHAQADVLKNRGPRHLRVGALPSHHPQEWLAVSWLAQMCAVSARACTRGSRPSRNVFCNSCCAMRYWPGAVALKGSDSGHPGAEKSQWVEPGSLPQRKYFTMTLELAEKFDWLLFRRVSKVFSLATCCSRYVKTLPTPTPFIL